MVKILCFGNYKKKFSLLYGLCCAGMKRISVEIANLM
jgi:hypothetical protein